MRLPLSKSCQSGLLAVSLCLTWPAAVWPQSITATLPVGNVIPPGAVAINRVTNKIYLTGGTTTGIVTVIDGKTLSIKTVRVGPIPVAIAINEVTNKIYVANHGGLLGGEQFLGNGSITVIEGTTNSTTTLTDPNAKFPCAIAVNPLTNKIYVANNHFGGVSVTVIDGATNSTTTVIDPNASVSPEVTFHAVAVNPVTNRIYVVNTGRPGNVTVIDGATNATTTVSDPNGRRPNAVAVNTATNKIYVTNGGAYQEANYGNVTVIDGATNGTITVTDSNALAPQAVAVDQSRNKIYVANADDSTRSRKGVVTVIDGATNSVTSVIDPNAMFPDAVAVDEDTNTIYVSNGGCVFVFESGCFDPGRNLGSITLIAGSINSFVTLIDPKANAPGAVAVDATTNRIYVPNTFSENLTVIDGDGTPTEHTVAVLLTGSGGGTVATNPFGIACGTSSCAARFAIGMPVILNPSAASGSKFVGWSRPCSGTGACEVVADKDQFVTATFDLSPVQVAVPNVVSQTQAAATVAITGAGLVAGAVTQQTSSTVASGYVISESPAAGTEVASGSAIDLVVSTGAGTGGGNGGGGGIDALTLNALLGSLLLAVRRTAVSARMQRSH